ncbi:11357_t:CDS:2 [Racocetra fulgida]|uniref:11357_t:CDS:1 n=1 Tax=Racocetra fulgida TaxID=60492 RepID=A0A9N9CLB7_9GLOM|nr:11357_t:CDS:2 [Racocetra fulgida]
MEITIDENIEISDIENYQYQDNSNDENNQYNDKYDNKNYQYDYENYQYNNENYQYDNEYDDQLEENYVNELLITENKFSEDLLNENENFDQLNWAFTEEFIEDNICQICGELRYDSKENLRKFAIYFPLIPRLRIQYADPTRANQLRYRCKLPIYNLDNLPLRIHKSYLKKIKEYENQVSDTG